MLAPISSERRESLHTQTQPLFDGDDCRSAWLMQQACAPTGLAILLQGCERHVAAASGVLGLTRPARWASLRSYHASVLRPPHDVLAAVWRCRTHVAQAPLPFAENESSAGERRDWLAWLEGEVRGWWDHPHRVWLFMQAASDPVWELGDQAAHLLARTLIDAFEDVPWKTSRQINSHR